MQIQHSMYLLAIAAARHCSIVAHQLGRRRQCRHLSRGFPRNYLGNCLDWAVNTPLLDPMPCSIARAASDGLLILWTAREIAPSTQARHSPRWVISRDSNGVHTRSAALLILRYSAATPSGAFKFRCWSRRRDPSAGRLLVRIVVACYGQVALRGMRPKPCSGCSVPVVVAMAIAVAPVPVTLAVQAFPATALQPPVPHELPALHRACPGGRTIHC
jgi:hypothetical protein